MCPRLIHSSCRFSLRVFITTLICVLWGLGPVTAPTEAAQGATVRVPMQKGMMAGLTPESDLFLEAEPLRGEGLIKFSQRLCGTSELAGEISAANGGKRRLLSGVRYRVPFDILTAELQLRVIGTFFEDDRPEAGGWRHMVKISSARAPESFWNISLWFTGRGDNYRAIREMNQMVDDVLVPGQSILIPAELLRPGFRSALPPTSAYHLEYGSDSAGEFATYRLKPGEALYSSVVIRFTGQVFAEDVNELSSAVAARSGIRDVRDIPVGFKVKIPLEHLLPEYLPPGHEKRQQYEQTLAASSRFSNQVRASRLYGVTVVLDAGHGGKDVGASVGGVWESVYVYDIMLRVRQLLETASSANVIATTQDGNGYTVHERDQLPSSKSHRVLVTPNYKIEDSRTGVHFRWYLANSVYRQALENGTESAKVVFLSIHADSLHSSLRGAMVYIPGAKYRSGSYGKSGSVYTSRREVRERQRVSYSSRERTESEGLSRDLAGHILDGFRSSGLAIHPDKPIREKVIRQRRAWVPAVLRYNAIPAQVLVEVCNLANSSDRKLVQTREFRQQVAKSIVSGVLNYYGQAEGASELLVAAAGQ